MLFNKVTLASIRQFGFIFTGVFLILVNQYNKKLITAQL